MVAPRSVEKGRGGAPSTSQDSSAGPGEDCGEAVVPLQPMKSMGDAKIHSQPVGGVLTLKQVDARESCVRHEWRLRAPASRDGGPLLPN